MADVTFDQRKWPHCTLFAISLAVSKACVDHRVIISSEEVRSLLFQYDDIYEKAKVGFFPNDFDGKNLKFYNKNPNADEYLNYTIKIENVAVKKYREGLASTRYVLVVWKYLNGDEDHCMYVIDRIEKDGVKCFKCYNSTWAGGKEPIVPLSQQGNNLHRVMVTVNNRISIN